MIYGQTPRVEVMHGFIVIGKETFRGILGQAERHTPKITILSAQSARSALYRRRELESWVPNLTRPKDRAMQDGAEAMNCLKRLSDRMQCLCGTAIAYGDAKGRMKTFGAPAKGEMTAKGKAVCSQSSRP